VRKLIIKIFITLLIFFLFFYFFNYKNSSINYIKSTLLKTYYNAIKDNRYIFNDYNVVFLPKTQFAELNISTKKIKNNHSIIIKNEKNPKFIEIFNNKTMVITSDGNFILINNEELIQNKNTINNFDNIKSNIFSLNSLKILGTLSDDDKIFISYVKKINDNCKIFAVAESLVRTESFYFKDIIKLDECSKGPIYGGRLKFYLHKNSKGILITTSDTRMQDDFNDLRPQNNDSLFNKILFYDFNKKKIIIFSKGHRNPAGLFVEKDLILTTEHGPRGGDEINKIIFKRNYGWPISSYGEPYMKKTEKPFYNKSHKDFNFEEPIFSFIPSIGISEIIKIPNNFIHQWKNNFLISSLNDKSLYRTQFSDNYNKILFIEKIYIGKKIRDLKYNEYINGIIAVSDQDNEIIIIKK
jgi:hypothetical protein